MLQFVGVYAQATESADSMESTDSAIVAGFA